MEEVRNVKKDLKPLIKLIAWIAGAVGCLVLVCSIISLIVLGTKDYTKDKEYAYKQSFMSMTMEIDILLKDNGTFVESATFPGEEIEIETGKYYVKNNILYVDYSYDDADLDNIGFEKYGKISATRIVVEDEESSLKATMTCKSAKTQQNISITFVVIGSILIVVGASTIMIIKYLDKKKNSEEQV